MKTKIKTSKKIRQFNANRVGEKALHSIKGGHSVSAILEKE